MFNIINLPMYGMTSNMNNKMSNNHLQYSENGHQQSTDSNQSTKLTFVDRLRDNVFIWDSLKLTSSHNTTESNSVFYTNSVDTQETESMVTQTENQVLRDKLSATKKSLDLQRKTCKNLITYFTDQINQVNQELVTERLWRTKQFSKLIKALIYFETKLKTDQQSIQQQLYDRDRTINRLSGQIKYLKAKYNDNCTDVDCSDLSEPTQFCDRCRQQYYQIRPKEVGVQTQPDIVITKANDNWLEPNSSGEENLTSFLGARRSKRYASKRTSGTFKDYLKSRSLYELATSTDNNNEYVNVRNDDAMSTNSCPYVDMNCNDEFDRYLKKRQSYSSIINQMHGINDLPNQEKLSGRQTFDLNEFKVAKSNTNGLVTAKPQSNDKLTSKEFLSLGTPREVFDSSEDWYASASDMEDSDNAISKPYTGNAINPVLECVNQILLQQSMDGLLESMPYQQDSNQTEDSISSSNSRDSTNSLKIKRVHFSTQNSMLQVPRDNTVSPIESRNSSQNFNYESVYSNSNEYELIGSENNSSHLYVDMDTKTDDGNQQIRAKSPRTPPALPPKPANLLKFRNFQLLAIPPTSPQNVQDPVKLRSSISSQQSENDYCSINDMNVKRNSIEIKVDIHNNNDDNIHEATSEDTLTDTNTEIEMIIERADLQSEADTDEIIAKVPKLPNVAAIIVPKKPEPITKFINNDNYIIKSPSKKSPSPQPTPFKLNILDEINRRRIPLTPPIKTNQALSVKMTPIMESNVLSPTKRSSSQRQLFEDKLQIQAEFDWYNLDAEYGIPNQSSSVSLHENGDVNNGRVLKNGTSYGTSTDGKQLDENLNIGIEYKLEEEYQNDNDDDHKPDTIDKDNGPTVGEVEHYSNEGQYRKLAFKRSKENVLSSSLVVEATSPITCETSVNGKLKQFSFDSFLDNSGLSSKPLPRQRRIFYTGPFV